MGSFTLLMSSSPCVRVCTCECVCVYNEADSSRVGIRGQSSLYAVCWAPRQKHCWAVKHSVTQTTCSRVEDRQTQTASAAPHQELVPYHQGLKGLLFDSNATLPFNMVHFICIRKLKSRTDCPWQELCGTMRMSVVKSGEKKRHLSSDRRVTGCRFFFHFLQVLKDTCTDP